MAMWPSYTKTRYQYVGLAQCSPALWRFVSLDWEGGGTSPDAPAVIGPLYLTKAEALGDLDRYARDNGHDGVPPKRQKARAQIEYSSVMPDKPVMLWLYNNTGTYKLIAVFGEEVTRAEAECMKAAIEGIQ